MNKFMWAWRLADGRESNQELLCIENKSSAEGFSFISDLPDMQFI